jgi:hypothetical protein
MITLIWALFDSAVELQSAHGKFLLLVSVVLAGGSGFALGIPALGIVTLDVRRRLEFGML